MSVKDRKPCLALMGTLMGVLLFMVVATAVDVLLDRKTDFRFHIRIVSKITLDGLLHPVAFLKENCYPVWHVLTWLTMKAFGCTGRTAAAFVAGGCVLGTWLSVVAHFLRRHPDEDRSFLLAASLLTMLVGPIYLFFFNACLIVGQWSPNLLHNPTHLMVRAVAVPCFLLYAASLERIGGTSCFRLGLRRCLALTAAFLLAAFSKPSFIQVFIPAVLLVFVYLAVRRGRAAFKPLALLGLTVLPAVAVCGLQFWSSFYSSNAGASGVEFAVLKVWSHHSPCVPVSWLLATAFPLVMAAWAVRARQFTLRDALAWLMLGFGLVEGVLLAEKGIRALHGNFLWGWVLGLFIVWLVAMDKFVSLARAHAAGGWRWWFRVAVSLLVAHGLSGGWYLWRFTVLRISV